MQSISTARVTLSLLLGLGLVLIYQPLAAADNPTGIETATGASRLSAAELLGTPDASRPIFLHSRSVPGQDVHAFTLDPDTAFDSGSVGQSVDPGNIDESLNPDGISWVASNYRDGANEQWSLAKNRAAAQIAIWALASRIPQPSGSDAVSRRATRLYQDALKHASDAKAPYYDYDSALISSAHVKDFFDGQKVSLTLGATNQSIPYRFINLYLPAGHQEYRTTNTDDQGARAIDIPWNLDGEALSAEWIDAMPLGTIVKVSGKYLVTTQGMPLLQVHQIKLVHPNGLNRAWYAVNNAAEQLQDTLGMIVLVAVLMITILGALLFKEANKRWKRVLPTTILFIAACVVATGFLAHHSQKADYKPFRPPAPRQDVGRQSDFQDVSATTSFAPEWDVACAFDNDDATAWISGRGSGVGQYIRLSASEPVWISSIQITPGVARSAESYKENGFPLKVQVIASSGQFEDFSMKRSEAGDYYSFDFKAPFYGSTYYIRLTQLEKNTFSAGLSEISFQVASPGRKSTPVVVSGGTC